MPNFPGHLLPGSLSVLLSLHWTSCVLNYYFKKTLRSNDKLHKTIQNGEQELDLTFAHNKLLQGSLMTVAMSAGFIVELITSEVFWAPMRRDSMQHMGIYFAFWICGSSYLFLHFGVPLPKDMPHLAFVMAYFIEALVFYFHLHGRHMLDVHVHTLMVVISVWGTISCAFEWKYKGNILAALGRPFCTFVQGTWITHIGIILFSPFGMIKWDQDNHDNIMVATTYFTWHVTAAIVLFTFLYLRAYCKHKSSLKSTQKPIFTKSYEVGYEYKEKPLQST